ncbi:MAG: hypothetical protein WDA65_07100 [Christensenellales bacterium]
MSEYFKLTDIDTLIKKEGDMAFVFDASVDDWVRDKNDILVNSFEEQDGEHTAECVPISEDDARDWIARRREGIE